MKKGFWKHKKGFSSMEYLLLVSGMVLITTFLLLPLRKTVTDMSKNTTTTVDEKLNNLVDSIPE